MCAAGCEGIGRCGDGWLQVFFGNLSWNTSWQDLKDKARDYGTVVRADVGINEQGQHMGFGFVTFAEAHEVNAAALVCVSLCRLVVMLKSSEHESSDTIQQSSAVAHSLPSLWWWPCVGAGAGVDAGC